MKERRKNINENVCDDNYPNDDWTSVPEICPLNKFSRFNA